MGERLSRLEGEDCFFRLRAQSSLPGRMKCPFLEQGAFWKKEEREAGKAEFQNDTLKKQS